MRSDLFVPIVYFGGMILFIIICTVGSYTWDYINWCSNGRKGRKYEQCDSVAIILASLIWPVSSLLVASVIFFMFLLDICGLIDKLFIVEDRNPKFNMNK